MRAKTERFTLQGYRQNLLVSQINYTLTNYAEHNEKFSHDMANRHLVGEAIRPHLVWENTHSQVVPTPYGFLVFDDIIVDKNFSHYITLVCRQYSSIAHGVIRGIGVVTCVFFNPETDKFWIIDYRIYDPAGAGGMGTQAEVVRGTHGHPRGGSRCAGGAGCEAQDLAASDHVAGFIAGRHRSGRDRATGTTIHSPGSVSSQRGDHEGARP